MEDRTGILIREHDIVLVMTGRTSKLLIVRGGATKNGLLRGINIDLRVDNFRRNHSFNPNRAIILSKPQVLSMINLIKDGLISQKEHYLEAPNYSMLSEETLNSLVGLYDRKINNMDIIRETLEAPGTVRDCVRYLNFVDSKK
jgi:hypothetical protein